MTPQRVQGWVISRYAQSHELNLLFSVAEANLADKQLVLARVLRDTSAAPYELDLIFYSVDLLPTAPNLKNQLFDLVAKKKLRLYFALEELAAYSREQLEDLMFMVWLSRYSRESVPKIIRKI